MNGLTWFLLGFIGGAAVMGILNEHRVRRVREDAREIIEADNRRRYGA